MTRINNLLYKQVNKFSNIQNYYYDQYNNNCYKNFKNSLQVNSIKDKLVILFDAKLLCDKEMYNDLEKLFINLIYDNIFKELFNIPNIDYKMIKNLYFSMLLSLLDFFKIKPNNLLYDNAEKIKINNTIVKSNKDNDLFFNIYIKKSKVKNDNNNSYEWFIDKYNILKDISSIMKKHNNMNEPLLRYITHHFSFLFSFIKNNRKYIKINDILEVITIKENDVEIINCCDTRKRKLSDNAFSEIIRYKK